MNDVPRFVFVIPIRNRTQFAFNLLPSLALNSSRKHDIVLVLDKCSLRYEYDRRPEMFAGKTYEQVEAEDRAKREVVYRWIDSHGELLAETGMRVAEFTGDERHWTGGLRCAAAMNMGVRDSTAEWVLTFGDEDLYLMPDWDEWLWTLLGGRDRYRYAALPTMVMPRVYDPFPSKVDAEWIHAQRATCCHQLTMPVPGDPSKGRIRYESLKRFGAKARVESVVEEPCGVRNMCHWVPMLMHRDLFFKVGGYPTDDTASESFDIAFDNALGRAGVIKRMPLDHFVYHGKHFMCVDAYVDWKWGCESTLRDLPKEFF